jgi:hypothetical protein
MRNPKPGASESHNSVREPRALAVFTRGSVSFSVESHRNPAPKPDATCSTTSTAQFLDWFKTPTPH